MKWFATPEQAIVHVLKSPTFKKSGISIYTPIEELFSRYKGLNEWLLKYCNTLESANNRVEECRDCDNFRVCVTVVYDQVVNGTTPYIHQYMTRLVAPVLFFNYKEGRIVCRYRTDAYALNAKLKELYMGYALAHIIGKLKQQQLANDK